MGFGVSKIMANGTDDVRKTSRMPIKNAHRNRIYGFWEDFL